MVKLTGSTSPNVLIVETDSRQTELFIELISDVVRAKVDTTNSGERAIELVSRTTYQLIVADCAISDMDGMSILERVKRVSPTTSVILSSAYATIEEAVKAMRSGADEYLKKPVNPEHFKLAVRRCLDRRALYTGDELVSGMMHLLNACQLVSGCLEEEKILETVTGYLRRETAAKALALFRIVGSTRVRVPILSEIDPDVVEVIIEGQNFIRVCREEKTPMKVIPKNGGSPDVAVFQFRCAGDAEYFVVCVAPAWDADGGTPADEVGSRFRLLQAQIQMTGRNIKNYRGVRHLLFLDEPTGLGNTRHLHASLDQQFEKYAKDPSKYAFSVLFIDVDKFKTINDQHGHLVGTKLLNEMGQIIRKCLRKSDVAFRYGGDEFVIMLEGASSSTACAIAEKMRTDVEKNKFLAKEGLNVRLTISVGVASCPEHAQTKRDIIDAADGAMYVVKRTSRNKVYIAERKAA